MRIVVGLSALVFVGCASPSAPAPVPPPTVAPVAQSTPTAIAPPSSRAPIAPDAPALPDDVRALQASIAGGSQAYAIVRSLTDDVGPRPAGSAGDKAAVAWALRALKAHGFANVHAEKVKVRHWERGEESAEIVAPALHALRVTALGWSTATPARGVEAEVVDFESLDALAAAPEKSLDGKIAFVDVHTDRSSDGSGYGKAVAARFAGAKLATKAGAVGYLVRSIGTDANRLPHTGAQARDAKSAPAAALSSPDADLLHRLCAEGKKPRLRLTLTPRARPDEESANVVGEIPGSDRADEVVLLGAHLDSWDLGTGAIDDGAGVAIVVDAARAIGAMKTRPRRTVRVVLFADEENGREGGDEYAKAHADEAAKIVVALEADLGGDRALAYAFRGGDEGRSKASAFAPWVAPLGVRFDEHDAYGGTDVSPLGHVGVPLMEAAQDATRYFDWHHTANDTFDKIDAAQITQAAQTIATLAWAAANVDGDLGRMPEDKRERPKRK